MFKFLTLFVLLCSTAHGLFQPPTQIGGVIRDLYYGSKNTGDWMMMAKEWAVEGLISNKVKVGWCGLDPVLGGSGVIAPQGSFSRTYQNLINHDLIYFGIGVKMIGNWKPNQDTLTLKVDGITLKSFTIFKVGEGDKSSSCSDSGNDLDTRLTGHFYHSASSVTITLAWDLSSSSEVSLAIADLSLIPKVTGESPDYYPERALLTLTDTLVKGISPSGSEDTGKTNCPAGSYDDGIYCKECDAAYQDCSDPSSWGYNQCSWNFGFDGNGCSKCRVKNCGLCAKIPSDSCFMCDPGFTLDGDGNCVTEDCLTLKSNKDLGDDGTDLIRVCTSRCDPGTFMLWNSTCVDSCEPPLVQRRQEGHSWCDYPCDVNEYLMPDGRCLAACPSGFSSRVEGFFGFCDLIVKGCEDPSLYMFQNGSCLQNCPDPYVEEFNDDRRFCNPPCPQGYFDPSNEVCMKGCEPDYIVLKSDILYCESDNAATPCPNIGDNRYSNGSCISSVCAYPFQQRESFCDDPCPAGYFFHTWENRCVAECKSENIRKEGVISFCDPEENCRVKSDYRHPDGTCKPGCPYPRTVRLNEEGYQFCEATACPDGEYFHTYWNQCVKTCPEDYIDSFNGVSTCWNLPATTGCANPNDYKYPNGSCLPSWNFPYSTDPQNRKFVSNFCGHNELIRPWSEEYMVDICPRECKRKNVKIEGGLLTCTKGEEDKTWCLPETYYKFANGTCAEYPPEPYLVGIRQPGANYIRAFGPCPNRYFNPIDGCSDTCPSKWVRNEGLIHWCDFVRSDNNNNNNSNACPLRDDYRYPNGSCLPICPSPRVEDWTDGLSCNPPCADGGYFSPSRKSCVDECGPDYIRIEDGISYCDGSVKVTVEIYVRYDIPLAQFNQGDYLQKFIDMVAKLLGVDSSQIVIVSITEGSTKINSKVELKSASDAKSIAAAKAKAKTMNKKLESAPLELDGIAVLNSRFGVTTPDNDQADVKKSSSSTKIIVIVVVIVVAAVAATLAAFFIHKYKVKRQSLQVSTANKAKEELAREAPEVEQDKKRDEEVGILNEKSRFYDGAKSPPALDQDLANKEPTFKGIVDV